MESSTYPANQAVKPKGRLQAAGFFGKAREIDLIKHGQLPCVADRDDHEVLKLGRMDSAKLAQAAKDTSIPEGVRQKAAQMVGNEDVRNAVKELADGY